MTSSVAQIGLWPSFLFLWKDLSHGFRDGYVKRGVAVQDGDAVLQLGDLSVEVLRHEPLAQQLYTRHFCLDAASEVVSAAASPERVAEVLRHAQDFVSCHGSGGDGPPELRVLTGQDNGMGDAFGDAVVALTCVLRTVGGDYADPLVRRDLTEQFG